VTILAPLLGLLAFLGVAWLLSSDRRAIDWRIVVVGLALQFLLGFLVLKTTWGRDVFDGAGAFVSRLLGYAAKGSGFVFGPLADEKGGLGFVFAFQVLPTIVFFSALMSVLYHVGILGLVVRGIGIALKRLMRVSGAEAFSAAANIFVGQTEAPFVVRPFLPKLTSSELFCVMTGGFATVAGGVMAAYILMFRDVPGFGPRFAGHLLAASVMSAPAALVMAKVMRPETEVPQTRGDEPIRMERPAVNVVDAAVSGGRDGMILAANVGAMLIAFLGLVALVNAMLGWVGGHTMGDWGWSLERGLGILCAPIAWLMGVPWSEATEVGRLVGEKTALNEFVAFQHLAETNGLSDRSRAIATYALCGFSNLGSIAIQVGGIGAMVPEKRATLARHGFPAMIAGSFACFMTACVAALLL
jgi:CNT family concentrative nucleoside transporter